MIRFFGVIVLAIFCQLSADGTDDLIPEAITVYRNPEFFKNLNYDTKANYNQKSAKVAEAAGTHGTYKYPGETKRPNPPASPGFEINYDNSPEFHHEPRDIFVDTTYKPKKKKGPYGHKYSSEETSKEKNQEKSQKKNQEKSQKKNQEKIQKKVQSNESEEDYSKESKENLNSGEEPRDFVSVFNENPEEEFKGYHEPILLARPNFDSTEISGLGSSNYKKPYQYNRTRPILYEEWKRQTYPKIHANEHLNRDSRIYSEEPSSNYFEDESPSYYSHEDDVDDSSNYFSSEEAKSSGADTKHIYKKLLKPKKSFLFKFHSKPKFKKLKIKLKKKHLHNTDWFDEYPFDF